MSFSSVLFLVFFLPATLAAYWLLPRHRRVQNGVLLAASTLFYFSWGPSALLLFAATTLVNYGLLQGLRSRDAEGHPLQARKLLPLLLLYNLGQLLLLKYLGFFASSATAISELLGSGAAVPALNWLVPIGLSFWTLQLCGHAIDVAYARRAPPQSLLDYAVFVAFFPQVLSGPIPRGDLLDQLGQARQPQAADFTEGAVACLLGFVMKFLVAASLVALVDPVYAEPLAYQASAHWLALYAYAMQIFCDFAGYSLMALGLGRFFGLRLIDNFRFPFLARNISEFWKRWHVSLTQFLFDYIYTPLVTGRGWMRGRFATGLFIVLLVSGLWHGATWMFVLWGGLHGLALVVAHRWDEYYRSQCRRDRRWVQWRKSRGYVLAGWVLTQGWFLLSLIPFRSPDLGVAADFIAGLFGSGTEAIDFGTIAARLNTLLCLLFVPLYHLSATARGQRLLLWWPTCPLVLRGVVYGMAVVYLFLFKPLSEGGFIYAQF